MSVDRDSKFVGSLNPVDACTKAVQAEPNDFDAPMRGRSWVVLKGER